jgi:hypothetical protein
MDVNQPSKSVYPKLAKGGKFNDNLYVDQLAGMSGARAVAVKEWAFANDLSKDDLLNIIQGLGRKQITSANFVSAVLGDKNATSEIVSYAKSGKGFKMADGGVIGSGKNGYIAFYKGKRIEVYADTMYRAQQTAAKYFKAKKEYEVNVTLAEVDGKPYIQSAAFAKGGEVEKPLSYYKYETPKVRIAWRGKIQPFGMFKSAEEAMMVIEKKSNGIKSEINEYSIVTPDKTIHLGKEYAIRYAKGGEIAEGNYEMMLSQAKEVQHHTKELQNILKGEKDIDAWVVAKMENVSSTLSDITHYLDGKTEYAQGGTTKRIKRMGC